MYNRITVFYTWNLLRGKPWEFSSLEKISFPFFFLYLHVMMEVRWIYRGNHSMIYGSQTVTQDTLKLELYANYIVIKLEGRESWT